MDKVISLIDVLDLFPLQARSVREEMNTIFDEITNDVSSHCETLLQYLPDKKVSPEAHCEYLKILENMQYADILSQRLEHIEQGLLELSKIAKMAAQGPHAELNKIDATQLLLAMESSCRMQQDREVLSEFVKDQALETEKIGNN